MRMVSGILTSTSLEPVLVSEGREGVRHHLHELQRRTFVVVSLLERFYESLEGPAEFLTSSFSAAITEMTNGRHSQRKGSPRPRA